MGGLILAVRACLQVLVVRIEGIVWSDLVLGDSKNANPDSGRLDNNGVILIIGAILWIGVVNQV